MKDRFNSTKRNYGCGRTASYAGNRVLRKNVIKQTDTQKAYIARWKLFCHILIEVAGIIDVTHLNIDIYKKCAHRIRKKIEFGELSIAYGVNILSAANRVMALLRLDNTIWLSPEIYIGRRSRIRKTPPAGMDKSNINLLAQELIAKGKARFAIAILTARYLGLRKREACLFDYKVAYQQAQIHGRVRICKGTKGGYGRRMQRWVPVDSTQIMILEFAAQEQGSHTSIIPRNKTLKQFMQALDREWEGIRSEYGLKKIHDLRASYACARYREITGFAAPVLNIGSVAAPVKLDKQARRTISRELGHLRIDIIGAYVGGRL
jgi:hypothetical protein